MEADISISMERLEVSEETEHHLVLFFRGKEVALLGELNTILFSSAEGKRWLCWGN